MNLNPAQKSEYIRLSIKDIKKTFNNFSNNGFVQQLVFENLSLSLECGTMIGIKGKTGCGKTTIGKIMSGIIKPDSGSVTLEETDSNKQLIYNNSKIRKIIRYVPQNPDAVLPYTITVKEALDEAAKHNRISSKNGAELLKLILTRNLFKSNLIKRKFGELSLGERRRIINARAIITNPSFMIMDEPFNGLDFNTKKIMMEILNELSISNNMGILIITHDIETIEHSCSPIWFMNNGKIRDTRVSPIKCGSYDHKRY